MAESKALSEHWLKIDKARFDLIEAAKAWFHEEQHATDGTLNLTARIRDLISLEENYP